MSAFTLDTTGAVQMSQDPHDYKVWSDLTPFAQGYVEALFAVMSAQLIARGDCLPNLNGIGMSVGIAFSDLSPEALGMILGDCARWLSLYPNTTSGANFWELRNLQIVRRADFPPLTLYLGDDGKIYLKAAGQ